MARFSGLLILVAVVAVAGDNPASKQQQQQLAKLQSLVGSWLGSPALLAKLPQGKYFSRLRLTAGNSDGEYRLAATTSKNDQPQQFSGRLDDQNQLTLLAEDPSGDIPRRLTFRFTASGDRLLLLMEKQGSTPDSFARIAEIGYTRVGSGFGNVAQGRECIVTGGLGTIEVSHNGKTYFVCCTGCRDYFNTNPEQVIAEFAAKKSAK